MYENYFHTSHHKPFFMIHLWMCWKALICVTTIFLRSNMHFLGGKWRGLTNLTVLTNTTDTPPTALCRKYISTGGAKAV